MIALRAQRVCALAGAGDGKHLAPNAQKADRPRNRIGRPSSSSLPRPGGVYRWRLSQPAGPNSDKRKEAPANQAQCLPISPEARASRDRGCCNGRIGCGSTFILTKCHTFYKGFNHYLWIIKISLQQQPQFALFCPAPLGGGMDGLSIIIRSIPVTLFTASFVA